MATEPSIKRLRAKQVGMLMQAYRRSHAVDGKRRGLSQERLLELMGQVDFRYMDRYDRSTVSRWEAGNQGRSSPAWRDSGCLGRPSA